MPCDIDALCAENAELRLISEADGRRIQELVAENKRLEGIIEQLRAQLKGSEVAGGGREMTLSCDHIYCPHGCTVPAGMCEACVRKALAEQRKQDAEIIKKLIPKPKDYRFLQGSALSRIGGKIDALRQARTAILAQEKE